MSPSAHCSLLLGAEKFAQELYGRLNKATKLDQVLDIIGEKPGMESWTERGFIPLEQLASVAEEFDMTKPSQLADFLRKQGMVSKVESRKVEDAFGKRKSTRSCILTPLGKELLSKRSQTTA
jgi:hypothetical protein